MKKIFLAFALFLTTINYVFSQKWKTYQNKDNVSSMLKGTDGSVWIGTKDAGIIHMTNEGKVLEEYTKNEGLIDNVVNCIFQDKVGNIWCGTDKGVSKFDLKTWTNYNISNSKLISNIIYKIKQDNTGNIWFGTELGLSKFDGKTWTNFSRTPAGVTLFCTDLIIDKKGNIWVASNKIGVSMYDGNAWVTFKSSNSGLISERVDHLFEDISGNIWFHCAPLNGVIDGGLVKYDGKNWESFINDKSNNFPLKDYVLDIFQDKNGNILFSAANGYLLKYDGKSWVKIQMVKNFSNSIYAITEVNNNYWALGDRTLYKFENDISKSIPLVNIFSGSNNVESVFSDNTGTIWAYTNADSLAKYDGKNWIKIIAPPINKSTPFSFMRYSKKIIQDLRKSIWMVTGTIQAEGSLYADEGLCKFDGKKWTTYKIPNNLVENFSNLNSDIKIYDFIQDNLGNFWFASFQGLIKFDGTNWAVFNTNNSKIVSNEINKVIQDHNGNLWLATNKGASKFDGYNWTTFNNQNSDIGGTSIQSVFEDRNNNMWFGIYSGKGIITKFDGKNWVSYGYPDVSFSTSDNGYRDVLEDNEGGLWFASERNGLVKFDGKKWVKYTVDNSEVSSNVINQLIVDKNGTLWFGTSKGISVIECTSSQPLFLDITPNQSVTENKRVDFSVTTKDVSTFQWQVSKDNTRSWQNIILIDTTYTGQLTEKLTLKSSRTIYNNYSYQCLIYNGCKKNISAPTFLTVTCGAKISIDTQASDQKVVEGQNATFQVKSVSAKTFGWSVSDDNGKSWFAISNTDVSYAGVLTDQLVVKNTQLSQNGFKYQCYLFNGCGRVISNEATLNVTCGSSVALDTPLSDQKVVEGQNATFQIKSSSAKTYGWMVTKDNGKSWVSISGDATLKDNGDKLIVENAQLVQNGFRFRCNLFKGCASVVSNEATLNVTCGSSVAIDNQASDQSVIEGQSATFQIKSATAKTFAWSVSKDNGSSWFGIAKTDTSYIGQNSDKLVIKKTQLIQNGYKYQCSVVNGCANIISNNYGLIVNKILANELEIEDDVVLYPNPSDEFINLEINHNNFKVIIFDIRGIEVRQLDNIRNISVKDLPKGIYFVQININQKLINRKVIIK